MGDEANRPEDIAVEKQTEQDHNEGSAPKELRRIERQESEHEKVARIRRLLKLPPESEVFKEASAEEKKELIDAYIKIHDEAVVAFIGNVGNLDRSKADLQPYQKGKISLADRAQRLASLASLRLQKVQDPEKLIKNLEDTFQISYSVLRDPKAHPAIAELSQLSTEDFQKGYGRLQDLGFYTHSGDLRLADFGKNVASLARLDDETYTHAREELNKYIFVGTERSKLYEYESVYVKVILQGGLTPEQKEAMELHYRLDHLCTSYRVPVTNEKGEKDLSFPKLGDLLNGAVSIEDLHAIAKIVEDTAYRKLKTRKTESKDKPVIGHRVLDLAYKFAEDGNLHYLTDLVDRGFDLREFFNDSQIEYRYNSDKDEVLNFLQSYRMLNEDPEKREWAQLFGEMVGTGYFTTVSERYKTQETFDRLFNNRNTISNYFVFLDSFQDLPEEYRPDISNTYRLDVDTGRLNIYPEEFVKKIDAYTQSANYYSRDPHLNYLKLIKDDFIKHKYYGNFYEFSADIPLMAIVAQNKDKLPDYGPGLEIVAQLLEQKVPLSDTLKSWLNRYDIARKLPLPALAPHLSILDNRLYVDIAEAVDLSSEDARTLGIEDLGLFAFIQTLPPEILPLVRAHRTSLSELMTNGAPSFKFLKEIARSARYHGVKEPNTILKSILTNDYIEKVAQSDSEKKALEFMMKAPEEEYIYSFVLDNITNFAEMLTEDGRPNLKFFDKTLERGLPIFDKFADQLTDDLFEGIAPSQKLFWQYVRDAPESVKETLVANRENFEKLAERTDGSEEKIQQVLEVMKLVDESPSQEMQKLKLQLQAELLTTDDPIEAYRQIESVFLKNNLPVVGKVFRVFQILYPNKKVEIELAKRHLSPVLEQASSSRPDSPRRYYTIYKDLLNVHIKSGNRSLLDFATALQEGGALLDRIDEFDTFTDDEKKQVTHSLAKLRTIQAASLFAQSGSDSARQVSGDQSDIQEQVRKIREELDVPEGQDIQTKIEEMFLRPLGIENTDEMIQRARNAKQEAHRRGMQYYSKARVENGEKYLDLSAGDCVKGVNPQFIESYLQLGIVAREYLGADADSDATPFGTDVIELNEENTAKGFEGAYLTTEAGKGNYGGLGFVFRDRGRFQRTTTSEPARYEEGKYELYRTGVVDKERHMDIRTGLPSTEVDYIVQPPDYINSITPETMYLAIAEQGVYIPVVDKTGKIIFTPEMYTEYRKIYSGLERFDGDPFKFKETTPDDLEYGAVQQLVRQIEADIPIVQEASGNVREVIEQALSEYGITLQSAYEMGLLGARLIDTGSSARHTNLPGDYDFDLMLLLDAKDFPKASDVQQRILDRLQPTEDKSHTEDNYIQIRAIGAQAVLEGQTMDVDMGISPKTEYIPYATHNAIADKLAYIKETYGEDAYLDTLGNIVLAKKLLKEANAYKKGEAADGGFGGVGTENWILQHEGNIYSAFRAFWNAAHDNEGKVISLAEFRKNYSIIDPGINLKFKNHDNYIHTLKDKGYQAMLGVIDRFLHPKEEGGSEEEPVQPDREANDEEALNPALS